MHLITDYYFVQHDASYMLPLGVFAIFYCCPVLVAAKESSSNISVLFNPDLCDMLESSLLLYTLSV